MVARSGGDVERLGFEGAVSDVLNDHHEFGGGRVDVCGGLKIDGGRVGDVTTHRAGGDRSQLATRELQLGSGSVVEGVLQLGTAGSERQNVVFDTHSGESVTVTHALALGVVGETNGCETRKGVGKIGHSQKLGALSTLSEGVGVVVGGSGLTHAGLTVAILEADSSAELTAKLENTDLFCHNAFVFG